MTDKTDFSRFGKTFQDKLTYLILTERVFADQIGEVLNFNFLEFKYLQSIVRSIYDYKEKYEEIVKGGDGNELIFYSKNFRNNKEIINIWRSYDSSQ